MKAAIPYGPRDVRVETCDDPTILEPPDAIIRLAATCIRGSDPRPYHGVGPSGMDPFFSQVHQHGGPARVRRYLPDLIDRIRKGTTGPGKVFDLMLPLDRAAEGYRAMDERRAIETLLTVRGTR